jgi:hypothetical protein
MKRFEHFRCAIPVAVDVFLWGFVKLDKKWNGLSNKITEAAPDSTPGINVWEEIKYRWEVCGITVGSQVEML